VRTRGHARVDAVQLLEADALSSACGAILLLAAIAATWVLPRIPTERPLAPSSASPHLEELSFAWFPSFGDVVDVTIIARGNHARLTGEQWEPKRFFDRGDLLVRTERSLSVDETADLEVLLARLDFWDGPTDFYEPDLDGVFWMAEARRGSQVKRVTCGNCDELAPLASSMLDLSELGNRRKR
jgi:hypothetical protein